MSLRYYLSSDKSVLQSIFEAQKFEYDFPDLNSPLMLSKIVLEERGIPVMAGISRLTAEGYFLIDPGWGTPEQRWHAFMAMHEAGRVDLLRRGIEDCYAWLPPQLVKPFGRRLLRLGWEENRWSSFHRVLEQPTEDLRQKPCVSIEE
jgi:hypothetical protein